MMIPQFYLLLLCDPNVSEAEELTWINNGGDEIQWINDSLETIVWTEN